jgi:hypothetical protein
MKKPSRGWASSRSFSIPTCLCESPLSTTSLVFSRSFSDDALISPLVIEAVEKYGRANSVHLVGEGERLAQTEATIDWCLEEMRQDARRSIPVIRRNNHTVALNGSWAKRGPESLACGNEPSELCARLERH